MGEGRCGSFPTKYTPRLGGVKTLAGGGGRNVLTRNELGGLGNLAKMRENYGIWWELRRWGFLNAKAIGYFYVLERLINRKLHYMGGVSEYNVLRVVKRFTFGGRISF